MLKVGEERERQSVARARLTTAQEMKTHYLNCLHIMINNSQTTTNNSNTIYNNIIINILTYVS